MESNMESNKEKSPESSNSSATDGASCSSVGRERESKALDPPSPRLSSTLGEGTSPTPGHLTQTGSLNSNRMAHTSSERGSTKPAGKPSSPNHVGNLKPAGKPTSSNQAGNLKPASIPSSPTQAGHLKPAGTPPSSSQKGNLKPAGIPSPPTQGHMKPTAEPSSPSQTRKVKYVSTKSPQTLEGSQLIATSVPSPTLERGSMKPVISKPSTRPTQARNLMSFIEPSYFETGNLTSANTPSTSQTGNTSTSMPHRRTPNPGNTSSTIAPPRSTHPAIQTTTNGLMKFENWASPFLDASQNLPSQQFASNADTSAQTTEHPSTSSQVWIERQTRLSRAAIESNPSYDQPSTSRMTGASTTTSPNSDPLAEGSSESLIENGFDLEFEADLTDSDPDRHTPPPLNTFPTKSCLGSQPGTDRSSVRFNPKDDRVKVYYPENFVPGKAVCRRKHRPTCVRGVADNLVPSHTRDILAAVADFCPGWDRTTLSLMTHRDITEHVDAGQSSHPGPSDRPDGGANDRGCDNDDVHADTEVGVTAKPCDLKEQQVSGAKNEPENRPEDCQDNVDEQTEGLGVTPPSRGRRFVRSVRKTAIRFGRFLGSCCTARQV